ncbi:MAG: CBS domain-containing protein [Alphaproteobacteria bacterium]|jgi:CBS domain-containing protein|nr:CBS domain-containing protein [Alphaproteobacteria bacterium]MBT7943052.1 CBS domain-containing protein [Alphaproteobacteria bacterium]
MQIRDIVGYQDRKVATIGPDALVAEAADIMDERKIGTVVVSSDGEGVIGIISERDIVCAVANGAEGIASLRVSQLCTDNPVICAPNDFVTDVWETMVVKNFRHMPVVEFGSLVGLVSMGDLIARMLEEFGRDEMADVWSSLEFI